MLDGHFMLCRRNMQQVCTPTMECGGLQGLGKTCLRGYRVDASMRSLLWQYTLSLMWQERPGFGACDQGLPG